MGAEWRSIRVAHSLGGIRVVNEYGPPVEILPKAVNGKLASFETPTYAALYSMSESIGLPILGVEFFTHSGQFNGKDIPEWRSFYRANNTVWGNAESARLWSDIGTGAHKARNGRLWDVGSRISQQLKVCGWRLKELSDSYHAQLVSVSEDKDFNSNTRFMNGYTWLCYLSIQSFLIDICILRDYLSEFAANFVFDRVESKKHINITTLSGLKKHVLNNQELEDPIAIELNLMTSDMGWLKQLGDYRDLVVHSAPLAQAERKLYAITKKIEIPGGELPYICCPIPSNPHKISASRANGSLFENFEEQFKKYVGAGEEENDYIDGLEYCHEVLGLMSCLANVLGSRSPVKPQMMVFNSSNIIGDVKISNR
ncbi:hypothetical protein [Shewanella cyperi]|uniref:hypothetical protein n=1 Tax=Shewanella cyperi TaxID=2814292 RepID=UPI001A945F24|nr:hypothetical protein [Shewanella cyperi]QSX40137.1 hypothetical protein JYB84_14330 [Shewanella cyperi]